MWLQQKNSYLITCHLQTLGPLTCLYSLIISLLSNCTKLYSACNAQPWIKLTNSSPLWPIGSGSVSNCTFLMNKSVLYTYCFSIICSSNSFNCCFHLYFRSRRFLPNQSTYYSPLLQTPSSFDKAFSSYYSQDLLVYFAHFLQDLSLAFADWVYLVSVGSKAFSGSCSEIWSLVSGSYLRMEFKHSYSDCLFRKICHSIGCKRCSFS